MAGLGYAVFDTAIGRRALSDAIKASSGLQLTEAREIDTRPRLFRLFPEARASFARKAPVHFEDLTATPASRYTPLPLG
jgi:hypothetical protein